MNVDTALVRELAEMLDETGLTEIEVEDGDRKIRVSRARPLSLRRLCGCARCRRCTCRRAGPCR